MYGQIDEKIRHILSQRLGQNLLNEDELLEITLELGKAQNEEELREAARKLMQRYPFLEDAFLSEKHERRMDIHAIVQEFIPVLLAHDPVKAAKLGELAMRKDVSLEELFEFSNEFKNYYEQKHGK